MRAWWTILLTAALAAEIAAQDGNPPPAQPEAKPAEEPKEPPAWKIPERDVRKIEVPLDEFLRGDPKDRADLLKKIEKAVEKPVDGHSMLEDVTGLVAIANHARNFNPKLKKGQVQEIPVAPEVHGFPAIGTVKYWLYVPKEYREDNLWPLLFCLPDQKKYGDGKKYVEDWVAKSPAVAESFLVVVPQPQAKGAQWTTPASLARAMVSLRHAAGTYGIDRKEAGPATDYLRVFIDGEDEASVIAARFPEVFAGAILRGADGRAGGPNVAATGQLSGMPAFCVVDPKSKAQREFAQKIAERNEATVVVEDASLEGNPTAMGVWMTKLPARAAQPKDIGYTVHDGSFQRHYWINIMDFDASYKPAASFKAVADRSKNDVTVEVEGISRFEIFLSDALVDLSRPVRIVVMEEGRELPFFTTKDGRDTLSRDLGTMLAELLDSNHPWRIYPVKLVVNVAELRARTPEEAPPEEGADKPAEGGKPAGGENGKPQSTEAAK
ncbi:MAG TPA: hypothetical protein VFY93_03600 [Planctomycetota bacterium]|nr:hypothetical protein [Planctomycetota bacterium]